MKTTFTKSTSNFGCYAENDNKQDKFLPKDEFNIKDVLNAGVPLKDKAWFIRKNCQLTDTEFREFAIGCALCVLPIYEAQYPNNNAPRKAIEAAKLYLKNEISAAELRNAAAAVNAAADAAVNAAVNAAADAAVDAAAAAVNAAVNAAADAVDAVDAAVNAAVNAAENYQEKLLIFFKEFTSK